MQRAAGSLKGSLDAAVTLYCAAPLRETLSALGDELRFVLITSAATLQPLEAADAAATATELPELRLGIAASAAQKCERCWHRSADIGEHARHPTLCGRCVENVDGDGERRQFA